MVTAQPQRFHAQANGFNFLPATQKAAYPSRANNPLSKARCQTVLGLKRPLPKVAILIRLQALPGSRPSL